MKNDCACSTIPIEIADQQLVIPPPVIPMHLASRLRKARERVQLTQEEVQARAGIGPSTLSEFENGHRQPSLRQLQALAVLYQRSVGWLLEDTDTAEDEVVLWRARPTAEVAAKIEARFLALSEQFRNLETWCGDPITCDLPRVSAGGADFGHSNAARLAKSVRDELVLGDRPGENLLRVLVEACGIKVFHLEFEPTGTAASSQSDSFGRSILLNRGNVPWRRNFDLAHELFHLLTWERFCPGWTGDPLIATEQEESLANTFAGNLLLPEEPFRLAVQKRIGEPSEEALTRSIDGIYSIAREFAVSVDAVLVRTSFLFGLDRESIAEARKVWEKVCRSYERRDHDCPEQLPERYRALAVTALRRGEISVGRFAEYMGLSRYHAIQVLQGKDGDGGKTAPTSA